MQTFRFIRVILNIPRILPTFLLYKLLRCIKPEARKIDADIKVWKEWKNIKSMTFFQLFVEYPEFRNVVYYRLRTAKYFVKWLYPQLMPLYIHCSEIGEGLMIQHGFSSTIDAEKIGTNCRVFQQVTIGWKGNKRPIIGDNVVICCGAKVFGGITIGNNVVIGANAVVCKDVPDNCVLGGIPAKIIKMIDNKPGC